MTIKKYLALIRPYDPLSSSLGKSGDGVTARQRVQEGRSRHTQASPTLEQLESRQRTPTLKRRKVFTGI